jgi:hypothetical protein
MGKKMISACLRPSSLSKLPWAGSFWVFSMECHWFLSFCYCFCWKYFLIK